MTGVRKCLDSVRFCWLPEGLRGFFPEPKPKWVLLLTCVEDHADTMSKTLMLGHQPSATKAQRENGVLDWDEHQGLRETPVAKKGHKEATGLLLASH